MDDLGSTIVSGAVGGAIAGLVVTLILAAYSHVDAKLQRREQISHIREMIATERANIYDIPRFEPLPDGTTPDLNSVRYAMFEYLHRELELALDGRSSEITFDEKRQIRRVFVVYNLLRDKGPDKPPDGLNFYSGIFSRLEEIEWLKLPRREDE